MAMVAGWWGRRSRGEMGGARLKARRPTGAACWASIEAGWGWGTRLQQAGGSGQRATHVGSPPPQKKTLKYLHPAGRAHWDTHSLGHAAPPPPPPSPHLTLWGLCLRPPPMQEVYFGNHFAMEGTSRKKSDICRSGRAGACVWACCGRASAGVHVRAFARSLDPRTCVCSRTRYCPILRRPAPHPPTPAAPHLCKRASPCLGPHPAAAAVLLPPPAAPEPSAPECSSTTTRHTRWSARQQVWGCRCRHTCTAVRCTARVYSNVGQRCHGGGGGGRSGSSWSFPCACVCCPVRCAGAGAPFLGGGGRRGGLGGAGETAGPASMPPLHHETTGCAPGGRMTNASSGGVEKPLHRHQ